MRRLLVLVLLLLSPATLAASYYISPTGSDTTPGTCTLANPCATFIRCNAVMVPGDTCYARGGTYVIPPDAAGAGGKDGWRLRLYGPGPKTFRSYPGEMAVLKPLYWSSCNCGDDTSPTNTYGVCVRSVAEGCVDVLPNPPQDSTITIGDARLDNYTFSDLTIYGRFNIAETEYPPDWGADDLILERNIFKCPGGWGQGNTASIMSGSKNTSSEAMGWSVPRDRLTIRNNLFLWDDTCPDFTALNQQANRYLDGPDFTHLYANKDLVIENNDAKITSTRLNEQLQYIIDQGRPMFRFMFWTKGLSQGARVHNNYCYGPAAACVSFNSGGCSPSYQNICYEGPRDGLPCTVDGDCNGGTGCRSCAVKGPNTPGWTSFVYTEGDNRAYNNISDHSGIIGWDAAQHAYNDYSYNNTIYRPALTDPTLCGSSSGCSDGIQWFSQTVGRGAENLNIFNNIVYSPPTDKLGNYLGFVRLGNTGGTTAQTLSGNDNAKGHVCKQSYLDNNIYWDLDDADGANFTTTELFNAVDGDNDSKYMESKTFSTLSAWKSYLSANCTSTFVRETSTREIDPLFVDAANGNFRLSASSPARTGGRGGSFPTAIGAYATGAEEIGCTFNPDCHAYGGDGGTQYYVRTDGADTNDGLADEASRAFKTVSKCLSVVGSGNTCNVAPGEYLERAAMTIPAGALVTNDTSTCTCTKDSYAVTCGTTPAASAGQYVKCDGSGPGFWWSRVSGLDGTTINLTEPYRGPTASSTLDVARLTRLRGRGTGDRDVKITTWSNKPATVNWVQDATYPSVWYYDTVGVTDAAWLSPKGFRTNTETWDTVYSIYNGRDPYFYIAPGACPCRVPSAAESVYKFPGAWYHDTVAGRVYLQTYNQKRPGTTNDATYDAVQAGTMPATLLSQAAYTILEGLAVEGASLTTSIPYYTESAGTDFNASGYASAVRTVFSNSKIENVWVEGARLKVMDSLSPQVASNFLLRNVKSMNAVAAGANTNGNSGVLFDRWENRGGAPNGMLGNFGGSSTTDRVTYNRIYFHRSMPPIYGIGAVTCNGNDTWNCSTRSWVCPNGCTFYGDLGKQYYAPHLWYSKDGSAANPGVNNVMIQNSIFEMGADGVSQYGPNSNDIWFVNNTFGTYANASNTMKPEFGSTAGTNWHGYLYNNLFMTHQPWNGGAIYVTGDPTGKLSSDYNVFNFWELNDSGSPRVYSFNSTTFATARSTYGQENNSKAICRSGCTGAGVTNLAGVSSVVQPLPHIGATNYTPLSGSPMINSGLNTYCPTEDFYGRARTDGQCDIGAVEYNGDSTAPPPDTTPPNPVTGFGAAPASGQVTLSWVNSNSSDNVGTMVRFSTTSYPANSTAGSLVCNKPAAASAPDSCVHTGLTNGTLYYYAAFSYDAAPNYGTAVTASATPAAVGGTRKTSFDGVIIKGGVIK